MDGHCVTEPRVSMDSYDFTPLVAAPGREVVVDLEAAAHPWDIGTGRRWTAGPTTARCRDR